LGLDGVVEELDQRRVGALVEVVDTKPVLDALDARLQDADRSLLLVDLVVGVAAQPFGDLRELAVPPGRLVGGAGDDQRCTGLVDQDGVDLVHDDVVVPALDPVFGPLGHVVAQVVEAELVVGAVCDVGRVRLAALGWRHSAEDDVDFEAQEAVDPPHPFGVVAGQVVVDGDDVYAATGQRVQVGRQGRDQGLTLTGLHLGDVAHVQGSATHELHVEVPLAEHAYGRLANRRESLGKQRVERLTGVDTLPELVGHRAQLVVGQRREVLFDAVDLVHDRLKALEDLAFPGAEDLVEQNWHAGQLLDSGHGATQVRVSVGPRRDVAPRKPWYVGRGKGHGSTNRAGDRQDTRDATVRAPRFRNPARRTDGRRRRPGDRHLPGPRSPALDHLAHALPARARRRVHRGPRPQRVGRGA